MPELPEVETTRCSLASIEQQIISQVIIRQTKLRWPVPSKLTDILAQQQVLAITRRGKYLLFSFTTGTLIIHLGMSGSLRIVSSAILPGKHDHVDWLFTNGLCLRFNDPRRFGAILWTNTDPGQHPLLSHLGPEPLSQSFSGDYLYQRARNCQTTIKTWLMNSKIVVGVGNIYANEALFHAKIHPQRLVNTISPLQYQVIATSVKKILKQAIRRGGTTLRNFQDSSGKPGYFKQQLTVYGRGNKPCVACEHLLQEIRLAQRTTVYCPSCQPFNLLS